MGLLKGGIAKERKEDPHTLKCGKDNKYSWNSLTGQILWEDLDVSVMIEQETFKTDEDFAEFLVEAELPDTVEEILIARWRLQQQQKAIYQQKVAEKKRKINSYGRKQ